MGAATIAIALVAVMWPGGERRSPARLRESHLPFAAAEQAYVPNVLVENVAMKQAESFLNQEITTLTGQIRNGGDASLANVEITVEFSDALGQIVLRESRALFTPQAAPLQAAEHRDFEVSFEHIPPSWNVQKPVVRVSGILFATKKE
jgi:hypothetical protein